jgi:hypothetical protein
MLNETDRDRRIVSDVGGQQEAREGKERKGKGRRRGSSLGILIAWDVRRRADGVYRIEVAKKQ